MIDITIAEKITFILSYLLLLEDPARFPGPLLDTTEIAFAIASTADNLSANVFLSERSASEAKRRILVTSFGLLFF